MSKYKDTFHDGDKELLYDKMFHVKFGAVNRIENTIFNQLTIEFLDGPFLGRKFFIEERED